VWDRDVLPVPYDRRYRVLIVWNAIERKIFIIARLFTTGKDYQMKIEFEDKEQRKKVGLHPPHI
jgi:hypothetical protein